MPDAVLTAAPTPFGASGELDTGTTRALFRLAAGTTGGLFVAGTTGEFPALDDAERLTLFEIALAEAGPAGVIAHVGAPDARRAARLAAAAAALGATRLAAITPYYLAPRPDEVTAYYLRIREAAPDAELYAYVFPERTSVTLGPSGLAALAEAAGLAGAKLSGSAAANLAACAAAAPGLRLYSGDDRDLAATLRAGGAGVISGRSAAFGEVFAALAAALAAGDATAAAPRQADVDAIAATGASIGRIKEALRLRGFQPMAARMPVGEPDPGTAAEIAALVRTLVPLASV
ncbi:MAG: dihydrodipicolinate synthase family protein [Streptosporangiaceae bacterium]|nr:dihydrodipicolinate synthase family protein [Streptosporangiaceae bacterium]